MCKVQRVHLHQLNDIGVKQDVSTYVVKGNIRSKNRQRIQMTFMNQMTSLSTLVATGKRSTVVIALTGHLDLDCSSSFSGSGGNKN